MPPGSPVARAERARRGPLRRGPGGRRGRRTHRGPESPPLLAPPGTICQHPGMKRTVLLLAALLLPVFPASAGGGPETTLVVVNAGSPVSRLVANEYAALRDIPESHLVYLHGVPGDGVVPLDVFLKRLWGPVNDYLEKTGLSGRIDLIAWSADFPYAVDFRSRLGGPRPGHQVGARASLSGLTYLIRHVQAGDAFWNLGINRYFRLTGVGRPLAPPALPPEAQALLAAAERALRARKWPEARAAFEKLLAARPHLPDAWYNYACVLSLLGEADAALRALDRASKEGFTNASWAARDPDLAPLRSRPEFRKILESMGRRARGRRGSGIRLLPAHGFRSAYLWTGGGDPETDGPPDALDRYVLSLHLAWTGFKGNSVPEVLRYLRAAARSDGTHPEGTVYICKNANVRSTARRRFFPLLVETLTRRGRKVEILEKGKDGQNGVLPVGKDDVIGAVVGAAGFSWKASGSRILPGAICEHLTSFGAHFGTPGQTKLTEFLRYGAAGASGTVTEPLAIYLKFPTPLIHLYYAEGCSLAEAFYQSVGGPYQLMIVGDGLARPFADFVKVRVDAPPAPWKGTVELVPHAPAATFELWVDGRRRAAGDTLRLDTTGYDDGHHDVRVVAVAAGPIETRSAAKLDAVFGNHGPGGEVEMRTPPEVPLGEPVVIRFRGARELQVLHGGRMIASSRSPEVRVPTGDLGPGPVRLVPRLIRADGTAYRAAPLAVRIAPPRLLPAGVPDRPRKPGLRGTVTRKDGEHPLFVSHVGDRFSGVRLRDRPELRGASRILLSGAFVVPKDGFYQLAAKGSGTLTLAVDGRPPGEGLDLAVERFFPLSLAAGEHAIRIDFVPKGAPDLVLALGGDQVLAPLVLRHGTRPALPRRPEIAGAVKGKPIPVPPEGLVLDFRRVTRHIAGLTLFPAPGAKTFPERWVVEYRVTGKRWKTVKTPVTFIARDPEKPPCYVEITFSPLRAKRLRVRPEGRSAASLSRIDVLGKE